MNSKTQKLIDKNLQQTPRRGLGMFLMIICCITISIGPLLFRNMESADIWQINIYRSVSWISALILILFFKYRTKIFKQIFAIGRWGIIAGVFLGSAQIFYMHALDNTTVANVLFILSSVPFVTALIAYLFIKETIKLPTIIMMAFAAVGIVIMVYEGISSGSAFGNLMAILTLLCFSCFPVILRKNRHIDMLPTLIVPALIIGLVGFIIKGNDINISDNDIILSFIWGGVLNGFAHAIFIIATRHLLAAEITLFMLLEFTLGPLWVWYFVGEVPAINTLYGGGIVMSAIAMLTFYELWKRKKLNNIIKEIGWNDNIHETTKMTDNNSTTEDLIDLDSKLVKQDIKIDLIKENQIKENIKVEIEKLLLPTLNKWFENDLKKMIKKHLDDQINELKKNN